ncbi:aminotransferase class I/II-fold pyridoxal phosphate-dependent enzyme [Shewanella morhuae]|uniref:8-amino-7-oxononanoate synthase n=1 Tax=Shewanella morhuae TaxID=365591 RepID=A0A379ZNG7_9GAMM|nr:8-amino-7-oxononanoate synthase [Shewanella morhuae]SUI64749.1 8-amino-7-oxononanoate synthase [Shewanella morhuae]
MSSLLETKIFARQQALREQGLLRQRKVMSIEHSLDTNASTSSPRFVFEGRTYSNFSSNDYLGLSRVPELADALHLGAQTYGVGSGASPLVTGYSEAHFALERQLCSLTGHEAALLFCSGFGANTALMKTLFDQQDTVIADKLVHASIIDGLQDSGAQLKRFLHNSLESAERLLVRHQASALITESVFSMDGDCAPITDLSALCRQHHTWLIVDDAHGFAMLNAADANGNAHAKAAKLIDVQVVTFGKALGCQGAAILGSQALIDFLVSNAREYIYSTSLSPANAVLALAAVQYSIAHPELQQKLRANIALFKRLCLDANVPLLNSDTAIQPLIIGDAQQTLQVADELKIAGIWVGAIRPPTVPVGSARLRITLTAAHSAEDIAACAAQLAQVLKRVNIPRVSERRAEDEYR